MSIIIQVLSKINIKNEFTPFLHKRIDGLYMVIFRLKIIHLINIYYE